MFCSDARFEHRFGQLQSFIQGQRTGFGIGAEDRQGAALAHQPTAMRNVSIDINSQIGIEGGEHRRITAAQTFFYLACHAENLCRHFRGETAALSV